MKKVYEKALDAVHGQAIIKTPFGEYRGIGIDTWIEKAHEAKQIAGWQILALILLYFGIPARPISKEDEVMLFAHWLAEMHDAIRSGVIKPYHPVTLLRISKRPTDYDWVIPLEMADVFMKSVGHDTKISEVVEKLYREHLTNINREFPSDAVLKKEELKEEKPLTTRERTTYLNIIGAMLELLQNPRPGRIDDASIVRELVENYGDKPGISERTLNGKFPEAKRSLSAS